MNTIEHQFSWLELMDRPAFCVKDGSVAAVNSAAEKYALSVGMDVTNIVGAHRQEYEEFAAGCLYLPINAEGTSVNASVTRTPECDIFVINQDTEDGELQALALAAQQLRIPLANIMTVADRLLAELDANADTTQQASQLNHNLFQLMRIVSNMSDAGGYKDLIAAGMETVDLAAVVDEVMEKIQTVSESTGIAVEYTGIQESVFGLANPEKLERAIYNLLSNALKFSTEGSTVQVSLVRNADKLSLTVCNTHSQVPDDHSYWNRYRRKPSIEDSRYGLGQLCCYSPRRNCSGGSSVRHANSCHYDDRNHKRQRNNCSFQCASHRRLCRRPRQGPFGICRDPDLRRIQKHQLIVSCLLLQAGFSFTDNASGTHPYNCPWPGRPPRVYR